MRIALGLEYHGATFCGWQSQPSGCGVQDTLIQALAKIAGRSIQLVAAGRTDAGVHASWQVAHFDVDVQRPASAWIRGTNALLPDTVAVLWAREVQAHFHARFSAKARTYRYVLLNRMARPGLKSHRVGWVHTPLVLEAMQQGCAYFCGAHDFSSFRTSECQAKSPWRTIFGFEATQHEDVFVFTVKANAFLHKMVRNMIAALVMIGAGKKSPEWIAELLLARHRSFAWPTMSPFGLYLVAVDYESAWDLPMAAVRAWPESRFVA
jgi:tRNA pseudouridine38-40 synthase